MAPPKGELGTKGTSGRSVRTASGSTVSVSGPRHASAGRPSIAACWNTSLPLRLNEFAILIVGRRWRSQVEWYAHVPIALKAGLSQAVIDQLKQKKRPEGMQEDEAIVYDFCTELAANREVSDATFERAKRILGEQQVVDLVAVSGIYVAVAMLLSVAEAMPPKGKELPFKPGEL